MKFKLYDLVIIDHPCHCMRNGTGGWADHTGVIGFISHRSPGWLTYKITYLIKYNLNSYTSLVHKEQEGIYHLESCLKLYYSPYVITDKYINDKILI